MKDVNTPLSSLSRMRGSDVVVYCVL